MAGMHQDYSMIDETAARLNTHEAVCAHRYENINNQFTGANARLKRIESWLVMAAVGVIGGFGSIIMMLFQLLNRG
jgi:ABC-type nickel/cobalt efflux system permease component RcnA